MENIIIWNVDTQVDFMLPHGKLYVPGAETLIPNLKRIFEAAERHNLRVLGSADEHNDDSAQLSKNGGIFPDHCMVGTEGQQNIPQTLLPGDKVGVLRWNKTDYRAFKLAKILSQPQIILTKDDNDVFSSPHIEKVLATIAPGTTIYVVGVATEYCVKCAVDGLAPWAAQNHCKVVYVSDAIREFDPAVKGAVLEGFHKLGAASITTSSLLDRLHHAEKREARLNGSFESSTPRSQDKSGRTPKPPMTR